MTIFAAFVDATDLKQWAERRTAQETLPEIVRRLVYATAPSASRITFRAGEGVQLGGWDGLVSAERPTPFVPGGDSGWELGVEKRVRGKAVSDFEARRDGGGVLRPDAAAFVFVTPQRFRDKVTWAADAARDSAWREVRAYDADDLATWLTQAPAVHAWASAELGKLPRGIRSLDDAWSAWTQETVPPFPPGLALAGRDGEAEEVAAWLNGEPAAHAIQGDTIDEALGFLASVVQQLPDDRRTDVLAKTVIVDDVDSWRQLRRFAAPLVLVPTFTPDDAGSAGLHTLIVPVDRSTTSRNALSLPRIRREPAERLLKEMGLGDDKARDLATLARRSLPALRRRLASSPVSTTPSWATPGPARGLIPVLLAGRWREDHDGDRARLEQLAGKPYRDFAADIAPWFEAGEPPVRRNGSVVLATAPDEMWDLLARQVTADDLRSFADAARGVLGEVDPRLSLDRGERWLAGVRGLVRAESDELREGVTETLLRIATHSEPIAGQAGHDVASTIAHALLDAAFADATGGAWVSLGDVLALLAEAAPDVFLRAAERGLVGEPPLLAALFPTDANEGFGAPTPDHIATAWALETLAWSPDHLGRATVALARLARIDPGGRISPRPGESLARILHPLLPQTSAPVGARIEVLQGVLRADGSVGFRLLLDLIPKSGGFLLPTHGPRRRAWREGQLAQAPFGDVSRFIHMVVDELLARAGADLGRWADIVELMFDLPPEMQSRITDALGQVTQDTPPDDAGRLRLLDELRRQAAHRRSQAGQGDTRPDEILALIGRFESPDSAVAKAWLFAHMPQLPLPRGDDWQAFEADLQRMREEAVRVVLDSAGLTGVRALAVRAEYPWSVGFALGAVAPPEEVAAEMLPLLLATEAPLRDLVGGWVVKGFIDRGWGWVDGLGGIGVWTARQWAALLIALPPDVEVWNFAVARGRDVAELYWRQTPLRVVPKGRHAIRAATELLDVGRPHVALDLMALLRNELEPADRDLIYRTLEEAASTPHDPSKGPGIESYDAARLLELIEEDEDADVERVARIEWMYLPLFGHGERPAKLLHGELARSPAFFSAVVSWIFKGDSEPPRELTEEERVRGRLAYQLLDSWRQPPGVDSMGGVDAAVLRTWVIEARDLVNQADRADIGDQRIGHILRYVPKGDDGRWPAEPVRDLLEEIGAEHIEIGMAVELRNSRGVTSRHPTEGGKQERELEAAFRSDAAAFAARWSRTAALMTRLADSYARDARREDAEADLIEDTWR
jgi:hypothetical protein